MTGEAAFGGVALLSFIAGLPALASSDPEDLYMGRLACGTGLVATILAILL